MLYALKFFDKEIRDCRISEVYRMTGEQIREYFNL